MRRIAVDYASHSAQVESIREELLDALGGIEPRPSRVPFYSTVTGGVVDTRTLDAGYWVRNLRQTVQFAPVIEGLLAEKFGPFIECAAHPVLAMGIEDAGARAVVASLRRDDGGPSRFATALAEAFVRGVPVNWPPLSGPAGTVELPTYPFQGARYWLVPTGQSRPADLGLGEAGHPFLGASVTLADDGSRLFTGRLSGRTQPWLADHVLHDTAVLPGSVFADLALHAGRNADCATLRELTLETPLVLPDAGAVHLQVRLGAADDEGRRSVAVYARPETGPEDDPDDADTEKPWTRHASGTVTPGTVSRHPGAAAPDPGSDTAVDIEDAYDRLAAQGHHYGPAGRVLRAAWRDGDACRAEIALPDGMEPGGHALHPALLDAAAQSALLAAGPETARQVHRFTDTHVYAVRATRAVLTARPHASLSGTHVVDFSDDAGRPLATTTVSTAPAGPLDLTAHTPRLPLHRVAWAPLPAGTAAPGGAPPHTRYDLSAPDTDDSLPACHDALARLLTDVQAWLADPGNADGHLVVVTHGAVPVDPADDVSLVTAPAWGLLRTAQNEHPGRVTVIDTDGHPDSGHRLADTVATALTAPHPQAALRRGEIFVPRLTRAARGGPARRPDPEGTLLITGGTGTLGRLVARHAVTQWQARHLLLISRGGPAAPGAGELAAELERHGAHVTIAACDASDPDALAALLDTIPDDHPLTRVVHATGVLDDGTLESLTPQRMFTVFAPKADAAWHLHRLTSERGTALEEFVMFSSLSGTLGGPGQANYAAANAYLDALAHHRQAAGQPAVSLAWGLWGDASGMTGHLEEVDRRRMARSGIEPITGEEALALLDDAVAAGHPTTVTARLRRTALRRRAAEGDLPPLFEGLVPRLAEAAPAARAAAPGAGDDFAARLSSATDTEREELLRDLVLSAVSEVLKHGSARDIDPHQGFLDLGLDSLTAVEVRNRLNAATGLSLPTTVVFDQPTAAALAAYLDGVLPRGGGVPSARTGPAGQPDPDDALDALEAALLASPSDADDDRGHLARRLRTLLSRLDAAPAPAVTDVTDASDDELLSLIDNDLGLAAGS